MQVLNGFVKIHRKLIEWRYYKNDIVKSVFIHILLTANYKDLPWENIVIKRGQKVTSYPKLAEETGHTVQQVRDAITKLKEVNAITVKTTNKYSLITVENWEEYQFNDENITGKTTGKRTVKEQAENRQRTGKEQQVKNNKNNKNNKKESARACACARETLSLCVNEFIPPTADEVKAYCEERGNSIDPERFVDYYTARNWYFGKSRISDWKAAVRSWEKTERENPSTACGGPPSRLPTRSALNDCHRQSAPFRQGRHDSAPVMRRNAFNNFEQKQTDYAAVKERSRDKLLQKWSEE